MVREKIINIAKRTLLIESQALKEQIKHIDSDFITAVNLITNTNARVVVMGIGKSGLIGKKIVATFSSVGIPSIFVHPAELSHGDIGMIVLGDIIIILSYSGESEELKKVLPAIKNLVSKIILFTGRKSSLLAKMCDIIINVKVYKEACPFNLVPTSSTTAMLAMGDALALCVSGLKGFKKEDYAKFHPGGTIGKKLSLTVKELMHTKEKNPVINKKSTVRDTLFIMTKKKLGATSVVDDRGILVGYFTDGDLRRKLSKDKGLLDKKLYEVMTINPKVITKEKKAIEAAEMMKKYNCDNLPVVDNKGKPIGMIDERDLISSGIL